MYALGEGIAHLAIGGRRLRRRVADDQRHMKGLLVVAEFRDHPVVAEIFTMIGGEDDQGVVVGAARLEEIDQPPDLGVDLGDHAEIGRLDLAQIEL